MTAKEIEYEISGKRGDPHGANARIAIFHLRKALEYYYKVTPAAINDWVRIELPKPSERYRSSKLKNPKYPIRFSYHPLQFSFRQLAWARMLMNTLRPKALHEALRQIDVVLVSFPDLFPAQIQRVECICIMAVIVPPGPNSKRQLCLNALDLASNVASANLEQRGAVRALVIALVCNHHISLATAAFLRVFELKPESALESLWYAALELLTDGPENAFLKVKIVTVFRPAEFLPWLAFAFYAYMARKFEDAENMLTIIGEIDPHFWAIHLCYALIHMSRNNPKAASLAYHRMTDILHEPELMMPGLGILIGRRLFATEPDAAYEAFIGRETESLKAQPAESRDWLQIALSMLDDDPPSAVGALTHAWQHGDPLSFCLKHWPIFDSIRDRTDFQELMMAIDTQATGTAPERNSI